MYRGLRNYFCEWSKTGETGWTSQAGWTSQTGWTSETGWSAPPGHATEARDGRKTNQRAVRVHAEKLRYRDR